MSVLIRQLAKHCAAALTEAYQDGDVEPWYWTTALIRRIAMDLHSSEYAFLRALMVSRLDSDVWRNENVQLLLRDLDERHRYPYNEKYLIGENASVD